MDCFKVFKIDNKVTFMLNPWFKNLSLMVDYIGHSFTIEIVATYDSQFFLPPVKTFYQKLHGHLNASLSVVQETMHNTNVVFKVRMFFG
jgi:hypothetical protein